MHERLIGMRLIKRIFVYKRLPLLNPTVLASNEEIAHTVFRFPIVLIVCSDSIMSLPETSYYLQYYKHTFSCFRHVRHIAIGSAIFGPALHQHTNMRLLYTLVSGVPSYNKRLNTSNTLIACENGFYIGLSFQCS